MRIKQIWNYTINNPFIHPIIWAVFPIFTLYTHNIDEAWPQILVIPILYSLIFTGASWIVFFLIFRNVYKTGMMLSIWLILFFSYGHLNLSFSSSLLVKIIPIGLNMILMISTVTILIVTGVLLFRKKGKLIVATNLFNFVGIILISMILYKIIPYEVNRVLAMQKLEKYLTNHKESITVVNRDKKTYPDIYYFVFDRYGRQDVLKEFFQFDNTKFIQRLKENNFYVDSKSNANYPTTFLSLASSLNMQHVGYLSEVLGENYSDKSVVYRKMLEENEIGKFLKRQGYAYINFGSVWKGFMESKIADENYNLFLVFDEFLYYIYENTLLNAVWGKFTGRQLYIGELRLRKSIENQNYQIQKIHEIIPLNSPKFVFGHFLLPHPPYLFSDDCTDLDFEVVRSRSLETGYRSQTNCANKIMNSFYEAIVKNSKRRAVIIFQSDEGPYLPSIYFPNEKFPEKNIDIAYKIHSGILYAVHLNSKESSPPDSGRIFSEGMTPVNTFRYIFNYYFGTKYKPLENRTYVYEDERKPFVFKEITEIVN